jgi:hypothetical protein
MVCEYNSNVLTALSLAINLARSWRNYDDDGEEYDGADAS